MPSEMCSGDALGRWPHGRETAPGGSLVGRERLAASPKLGVPGQHCVVTP